ncbi:MAG: type II toxin-antitoxin system RelB/DinJ family antitoxin [Ruminococcus sp.]|nr:type II toxin-antitoxin system RelB/DinJ family antitoxin [Ruminococcus sp.]
MRKDSTISVRVQSDIKEEAETILKSLGIPVSVVINSLYRQIVYRRGIPFPLTVPSDITTLDTLSEEHLNEKLSDSYAQSLRGDSFSVDEFFDVLEKGLEEWKE